MPASGPRVRRWCFTINNPTEEDNPSEEWNTTYVIYQYEQGENGTPHYQGYAEFDRPRSLYFLKQHINSRAHWLPARGNGESNRQYCTKDKGRISGPWSLGKPKQQGRRSDILSVVDSAESKDESTSFADIVRANPHVGRYLRLFDRVRSDCQTQRTWILGVYWIYGPSGSGKTRRAYETDNEIYAKELSHRWWDGYRGERRVLLDDFGGLHHLGFSFTYLLRLLDRYPMRVEVKGGMESFRSEEIFITSIDHPNFYFDDHQWPQVKRRITEIISLTN